MAKTQDFCFLSQLFLLDSGLNPLSGCLAGCSVCHIPHTGRNSWGSGRRGGVRRFLSKDKVPLPHPTNHFLSIPFKE